MIPRLYRELVDLVLEWGTTRWAIEVKLTSNPSASDLVRFNKAADMIGAERRILLCRTTEPFETGNVLVTHPADWCDRLRKLD